MNDIAKDHPDLVADIAKSWFDESNVNMTRMLRHGCRTLLKSDHSGALTLFGYEQPDLKEIDFRLEVASVAIGSTLSFVFCFHSNRDQDLMIDYVMYHQKSNGELTPKVFKWKKVKVFAGQSLEYKKVHSFKKVTTRRYYAGTHKVDLKVNGQILFQQEFMLKPSP